MDASAARVLEIGDLGLHQGSLSRPHHAAVDRSQAAGLLAGPAHMRRRLPARLPRLHARQLHAAPCATRAPAATIWSSPTCRSIRRGIRAMAFARWRRPAASMARADARLRRVVAAAGVDVRCRWSRSTSTTTSGSGAQASSCSTRLTWCFKRELPADRWQVLARIRRIRRCRRCASARNPAMAAAAREDSPDRAAARRRSTPRALGKAQFPEKTADVFFSGKTAAQFLGAADRDRGARRRSRRAASRSTFRTSRCRGRNSIAACRAPGWRGRRRASAGNATAPARRRSA